jgi:hypothetical protein
MSIIGIVSGFAVFIGSFYAIPLAVAAPQHQHGVALAVMMTPGGWINGALYYGVIQGNAVGWLFLAPVAITSVYNVWWLRRGYAIREFQVWPQGVLTPVFEFGIPNPRWEEEVLPAIVSDTPAPEREPEEAIEKRLLQSPALAPPDWGKRWFMERWIGAFLTPRERTLLEQLYGGPPRWTATCLMFAAAALVLIALVSGAFTSGDGTTEYHPSVAIMYLLLAIGFCTIPRYLDTRPMPPLHPIFPVGLQETLAAIKKSLALRAIIYVPLLFAVAFAEMRGWPNGWRHASIMTLILALLFVAWYLITARASFCALNRRRYHWRRWTALAAMGLAGFISFPLTFVFHPITTPLLGLLAILLIVVACRQFDRVYLDTEFDFEMANP